MLFQKTCWFGKFNNSNSYIQQRSNFATAWTIWKEHKYKQKTFQDRSEQYSAAFAEQRTLDRSLLMQMAVKSYKQNKYGMWA